MINFKKIIWYLRNPREILIRIKKFYFLQNKYSSYELHNQRYKNIYESIDIKKYKKSCNTRAKITFNSKFARNYFLLKKHKEVRYMAVDIGSGVGWLSNYASKYFQKVIAIEPTYYAHKISRLLYSKKNIIHVNLFAEDALKKIKFKKKTFFFSFHVLSHLEDRAVSLICHQLNQSSVPIGSILSFSEIWTKGNSEYDYTNIARSIDWWKKNLSNYKIDFFGPRLNSTSKSIYKGFHGYKVK